MRTHIPAAVNHRYFLNRLALEHSTDSLSLDPAMIISSLFTKRSYPEMILLFEDFCEAAVAPAFCWKQGVDELLCFSGEMEQLIEASYLLYRQRKMNGMTDTKVLRQFFHAYPLQAWKRILRDWTNAAMSHRSVAETGEAMEMLPFVRGMDELLRSLEPFSLPVVAV
jgi:hypothetical protein